MLFTGTYEHNIDAKHRLAIPSEIRAQLRREGGLPSDDMIELYVAPGQGPWLRLFTSEEFERQATALNDSDRDPDEVLDYETVFYSLTRKVAVDAAGRIRLPENLLTLAGLGSEVVLLGAKDHLQVRDRATWQKHIADQLARDPGLMSPRLAMRRRKQDEQNSQQN